MHGFETNTLEKSHRRDQGKPLPSVHTLGILKTSIAAPGNPHPLSPCCLSFAAIFVLYPASKGHVGTSLVKPDHV